MSPYDVRKLVHRPRTWRREPHAAGPAARAPCPPWVLGLAVLCSTLAPSARAEDARALPPGIEAITVTARKRPEAETRIPVSMTVVTRRELQRETARRLSDLATPNLEIAPTVGLGNASRASLRGVGQFDITLTTDPGVGLYLDGVYLGRPQSGLLALADLERVEVLRGPQGTVFGKNTIGGAIHLITAQPEFEFGVEGTLRYGDFDELETRLQLNLPVVAERAALRVSLATTTRDGFQRNVAGGSDAQDDKLLAGRVALRLLPRSDMELRLSADLAIENKIPQAATCVPTSGAGGPTTLFGAVDAINRALVPGSVAVGPRFAAACAESARFEQRRRYRSDQSFNKDELESFGIAATWTWDLGDATRFTSITASRGLRSRLRLDFDGTDVPFAVQADSGEFEQDQLSQELQLTGDAWNGQLRYLVGAYGFRETSDNDGAGPDGPGFDIATFQGFSSGPALDSPPPFVLQPFATAQSQFRASSTSYAAFGQLSFDLTDSLELTAGLRFTHERKRFFRASRVGTAGVAISRFDPSSPALLAQLTPQPLGQSLAHFDRSQRFRDFSPSASLTYRMSDDLLAYASFSTGFKSGGFDARDIGLPPEVDPEKLTTYEIGVKATALDGRVRADLASFYSVYRDVQLTVTTGNPADPTDVLNAGRAIIRGGEVELTVLPFENLVLEGSLGVLATRYQRFDDVVIDRSSGEPVARRVSRTNLDLPFSPNYSLRFAALYTLPLGGYDLVLRTDWEHKGAQALDVANTEQLRQGKYGQLGARIGVESSDGQWEIALYGRNLLDRSFLVSGFEQIETAGFVGRFRGSPRTFGVELRIRY